MWVIEGQVCRVEKDQVTGKERETLENIWWGYGERQGRGSSQRKVNRKSEVEPPCSVSLEPRKIVQNRVDFFALQFYKSHQFHLVRGLTD